MRKTRSQKHKQDSSNQNDSNVLKLESSELPSQSEQNLSISISTRELRLQKRSQLISKFKVKQIGSKKQHSSSKKSFNN